MSNQWGRPQRGLKLRTIGFWVVTIVVMGLMTYQFFPKFTNTIYSLIKPINTKTNNSNSLPITNSALNSFTYSIKDSPDTYSVSSQLGSNEATTGYSLLLVTNGMMNQLSVDAETTAFIQQLIKKDRKIAGKNKLLLVENGRFRQFMVSDEIYSVVSNLSIIDTRVYMSSANSNPNRSLNSSLNTSINLNVPTNSNPNSSTNSNSSAPSSTNQPSNSSIFTSPSTSINSNSDTSSNSDSSASSDSTPNSSENSLLK